MQKQNLQAKVCKQNKGTVHPVNFWKESIYKMYAKTSKHSTGNIDKASVLNKVWLYF